MPLSRPVAREPLHTRRIECKGYRRADGLFDIEATLTDTKSYAFDNDWRGTVEPGDPIHRMEVRVTIDEDLVIHAVEAETTKSPFEICGRAAPRAAALAGLRIGPGWMKEVKRRYGRDRGCTHILELMYPIGTTAFQTIFPWKQRRAQQEGADEAQAMRMGPPLDSCYAFSRGREVVRRLWPERYVPGAGSSGEDTESASACTGPASSSARTA